jgi:hypothetical protein
MMVDALSLPFTRNENVAINFSPVEVEWEVIVSLFHASFRETFARSKKVFVSCTVI